MNYAQYMSLFLVLPLLSFAVLGIWGRQYIKQAAGLLGTGILAILTGLALYTAYRYFLVDGQLNGNYQPIIALQLPWLQFGYKDLSIDMGMVLDPISVMMLVVITVVSLMVHIFSLGYMKGEERYATYYAFLSLFTFSMLGLVVAVNIFQIYIFWELVGVSSYLLIGYYFTRPSAVAASKKAFIVTRFADLGFLIGILILGFQTGTFDFGVLIERLTNTGSDAYLAMTTTGFLGISTLTWALVLVFMGGAGKSAMFPLHVWLPDAMEGPTPVSALIHAATMVVAGVFLVARLFPVFSMDNAALSVVSWVGAISAIFAAVIACTQTDIKRVLAYSTMSQIGYMMFALGVSGYGGEAGLGYSASMFHLFTHAFFKSLLFLGAGAIIHKVHSNDMNDMGGLRKSMPVTHISFLVACLAIAGIPPLSGFFSKEEILLAAWQGNKAIYAIGLITAGLTAFYMFRLYFMIFWQKETPLLAHAEPHGHHHEGEAPWSMKLPLVLLAILSVLAGLIPFASFVSSDGKPLATELHLAFSLAPVAIVLAGMAIAFAFYKTQNNRPANLAAAMGSLYRGAYRKFYIDELYLFITHQVIFKLVGKPAAWIDKEVVDGSINGLGNSTEQMSTSIKGLQSGKVQAYAMVFFAGILVLTFLFVYWWI